MSNYGIFIFFQNQTTSDVSPILNITDGGFRTFKCSGVFDGAKITIEVDFADDEFSPIRSYEFTETDVKFIQLRTGLRIRANLQNANAGTNLSLKLS